MTDLHELDAFAAVARHRSFSKAALERGISASALSHAIRGLEEGLGIRLLNRTTRSVTPTEAGATLLAQLEPAIRGVAETLAELRQLQGAPTGKLRLNMPRPAARLVLAPLLAGFSAAYPRIHLEVVTDDGLVDIVKEGFDAGVRFGERLAADMIAVPFGAPQSFVVVASPAYLASRGVPMHPRDLAKHVGIGRRFPSGARYVWEFESAKKSLDVEIAEQLLLDDDDLIRRCALDGNGLAYLYENDVRADIVAGALVPVLRRWYPKPSRFYLYFPHGRRMPAPLRTFVDYVKTVE